MLKKRWSVSDSFWHQVFPCVLFWLYQDYIALWCKDAAQQSITGGQDSKHLCDCGVLPRRADISRDKGYPHCTKNEHAEGDESGLIEVVWEFPCQEGQEEAKEGQQANVAQDESEGYGWTFITQENDNSAFAWHQLAWSRGSNNQPHYTDNYLQNRLIDWLIDWEDYFSTT